MKITRRMTEVPVRNETDVLVVGAGTAGFGAAVAAARQGARVTLIERGGMAGGMWTLGLLSPFFDNKFHDGLNRELRDKLSACGGWGGLWDMAFDQAQMTLLLDEYLVENKIDVLFYSFASEAILEGDVVKGVVAETKSGGLAILAKIVVDCTGDGDVAASAGAAFDYGRPEDGLVQPMTMMFKLGGVSEDYPRDATGLWYAELCKHVDEAEMLKDIPFNYPAIIKLPRKGEALIQWTHVRRASAINADELSAATLEGRRQVRKAMALFPLIRDLLGDVHLLELPSVIGVRESRRIKGDYTISDEDVINSTKFNDNICRVHFGIDIHEPSSKKQTCISHNGFDIPARALLVTGRENLMTAGRCISGSYKAHAAYRVTGDCLKMGEEAGAIAAAAALSGRSPREVVADKYFQASGERSKSS